MKAVPEDVIVNAESLRLWYLGDGSLTTHKKDCMELRLSTESFTPEDIDGILLPKLYALGVKAKRNGDGRILVRACSYPRFFELIGSMSPISCYDYKYRLPQWRFSAKRMSQVAQELSIDYQQLAYWVKIGKVPCYRASEKGKPRFLPEHIAALEDFCEKLQLSEREYA